MASEKQPNAELRKLRATLAKREAAAIKQEKSVEALRSRHRKLLKQIANLKQAQRETIQRERLQALGQMASGIVHDFNNSLTPILGASDFLLTNPDMLDNKTEAKVLLESVRTAARDAKNVVHRLREFYKPDEDLPIEQVDINPLIDQVVTLTQPKWQGQTSANGTKTEISAELGDIPPVRVAESDLREVLTNLILNSLDATAHGGRIAIKTEFDGKWVVIKVTDTGKGMTEEVCQRCFEPFFSTKGKSGTGLGLAMAYGVIQKYKGTIAAESELGKGTTMTICLPPDMSSRVAIDDLLDLSPPPPLAILVADDDLPSRDIVTRHLRADGHDVETAAKGADVLALCARSKFDVVLLDGLMFNSNTLRVASDIAGNFPDIRIILLTGFNDRTVEGNPEGVHLILEKPITRTELRHAIARVLGLESDPQALR